MVSKVFDYLSSFISGEYSTVNDFLGDLRLVCIAIALIGLASTIFSWLQITTLCILADRLQTRCRLGLFESLMERKFEWFEKGSQNLNGELIQLNRSIEEYRSSVGEFTAIFIKSIFTVISLFIASFILCWRLTLLVIVTVPLMGIILFAFGRFIDTWAEREDTATSEATAILDWNLNNFAWVKTAFTQDTELSKFNRKLRNNNGAYNKFNIFTSAASSLMRVFSLMMFVQSFWFGSFLVQKGYNTSGEVLSSFYACLNMATTFQAISIILVVLQKGAVSFEKILKFIGRQETKRSDFGYIPRIPIKGEIVFKDVGFQYNSRKDDHSTLQNINISVKEGGITFLVGKSGSGKSTIGSLLLRLYKLEKGTIYLDGYDIEKVDKYWLRDQICFVQQFSPIFEGSIRENIVLGTADVDRLDDAINKACLNELVHSLPHGLDTIIGKSEDSFQPSGGEKQRIALARCFLRDSPVLILDESMSAIDISQRKRLMKTIRNCRQGKTTIIISHETSEIDDADEVYLIDEGEIKEYGLKEELRTKKGFFEKMESYGFQAEKKEQRPLTLLDKSPSSVEESFHEDLEKQSPISSSKATSTSQHFRLVPRFLSRMISTKLQLAYIIGVTLSVCRSALTPLFSYCFSKLIAGIVPQRGTGLTHQSYQLKWSLILTGIALSDGLFFMVARLITGFVADKIVESTRSRSFSKILSLDMNWFQDCKKTEMSTQLMNDTRDMRSVYGGCIDSVIGGLVIFIVGTIWAAVVGWKLALVGLSFFPLFGLVGIIASILSKNTENEYKGTVVSAEDGIQETVRSIRTVVCLNLQHYVVARFQNRATQMLAAGYKRSITLGMNMSLSAVIVNLAQAILFYYGLKLVVTEQYNLVQTMQVIMLIMFSSAFSASLLGSIPGFHRGMRVASKLNEVLNLKDDPNQNRGYNTPNLANIETPDAFELITVDFSYSGDRQILDNFCLSIPKNSITCLVGSSGCGKSTVLSLLLRLYTPQRGNLLVGGYDENTIKLGHLRQAMAVVPQKHYFLEASIRDNLLYGNPASSTISDETIMSTLALVNMDDFIDSLSQGLDTKIGGDSKNMVVSGGQAQRLCIVRALLRPSRILILDECTSSLDPYNAELVTKLLTKLKGYMSIVMVTHKEEMMKLSDTICMLSEGSIVEEGSYDDLMAKKGKFYNFVK
ncbi:DEKNAAC103547 [Brettanomyces naardenensis]|uniref:DEKNAAC103547 n=1 Tax=Brettanomyces naardenensis TaxID=13370 RepID=A0A448YN26_BRENA|nr:DEKNAAC103547 [Brettanomyces naardenensis]